jgi:hypothetical protein
MQRNTYYDRVTPGTHKIVPPGASARELACA